jgi:hypothetical protein
MSPQIEKQQFRNETDGYVGAVVIGPKGEEKGIAVEPGGEVWLSEQEQVLTANAPRSADDNPFVEQSMQRFNPESGENETVKVTPLVPISEARYVPAGDRYIPGDVSDARATAAAQSAATGDEPTTVTAKGVTPAEREEQVEALGEDVKPGAVLPASDEQQRASNARLGTGDLELPGRQFVPGGASPDPSVPRATSVPVTPEAARAAAAGEPPPPAPADEPTAPANVPAPMPTSPPPDAPGEPVEPQTPQEEPAEPTGEPPAPPPSSPGEGEPPTEPTPPPPGEPTPEPTPPAPPPPDASPAVEETPPSTGAEPTSPVPGGEPGVPPVPSQPATPPGQPAPPAGPPSGEPPAGGPVSPAQPPSGEPPAETGSEPTAPATEPPTEPAPEETAAESPGPEAEETGAAVEPSGEAPQGEFAAGEEVATPDAPAVGGQGDVPPPFNGEE